MADSVPSLVRNSLRRPGWQDTPRESRTALLQSPVCLVEDLRRADVQPDKSPEGFCAEYQICLPYRGLFVWHVGREAVVGDPNQVVFVRAGEYYRMSAPVREGYDELIITPDVEAFSEIAHRNGARLADHPLFHQRTCQADPRVQILRARLLHRRSSGSQPEDLETEELVLELVRATLQNRHQRKTPCSAQTARLIRRTKEFIAEQFSNCVRLADIGTAVGASPAYLTDVFRRIEGLSLHQYVTRLRLSRALVEVPCTDDLTGLALEIGFSSHSHFSAQFRRAFGCTPSQFRHSARGQVSASCAKA
jgi:AraC family transcriptional regulator